MAKFFSRLSYSIGNEDWETERDALKIQASDVVLCVTASGDRPLNLLMRECKEIVAIDLNPTQNHLLELKIAAMQSFDYETYLSFLGATNHVQKEERLQKLKDLLPLLSQNAKDYWLKHTKMIQKGVLYQGAVERLTKVLATILNVVRPKIIKKLFTFTDLAAQRQFVQEKWNRKWWKKIFVMALNPRFTSLLIEDPGLMNIGTKINPGEHIYNRIMHSLHHCLANQNLLLSLLFRGYASQDAFSPYLTQNGIETIKKQLDRITIETNEVVKYLESFSEPTFDCFSLSDIASYMDHAHFIRLLKAVHRTAKPGARFCIRQFLSTQQMPEETQSLFKRDTQLEKKLEEKDRCFIYRFIVGTVINTSKELTTNPEEKSSVLQEAAIS